MAEGGATEKDLAIRVIKQLWPDVTVNPGNVTPDVAQYVFAVLIAAQEGHQVIKSMPGFLTPATSWTGLSVKIIQAVRKYTDNSSDWGLAVRSAVAMHRRHVAAAMKYGTDVYPIQFR